MKKVLVLGSKGMAGHVVKAYLESLDEYQVFGMARNVEPNKNLINLDISETNKLEETIRNVSFDVVINCVGLLNKNAEDNPEKAIWINSYLPHFLSYLGGKYKFKLIHISTDCVFSGRKGSYKEDALKNGIGIYSQSKALGEINNSKDLTFRTSIIGPELNHNGIGLFHWFMNQKAEVFGFSEAYWSGVTTIELSKGINEAIQQELTGLYHFVNNKRISKYDILKTFNNVFRDRSIKILKNSNYKVDKSLVNTRSDLEYCFPCFEHMIIEMKEWMNLYKHLYGHYNR